VVSVDPASKVVSIVIGIVGSVVVSVDPASKVVSIVIGIVVVHVIVAGI
jgi:hypothetical protein